MNEKKVRFLASQAGIRKGPGLLWEATDEQVAELIRLTEMRTLLEMITGMANAHDAIAAQSSKIQKHLH